MNGNTIKRILIMCIGFFTIFYSIEATGIELKWWQILFIILGVCVVNIANIIYPYEDN